MALIKCPECGKEFSDKATYCPNCACPVEQMNFETIENVTEEILTTESAPEQSSKKKKLIPVIAGVVIVAVIGIIVYNLSVIKPKNTYEEAVSLLEEGKYEEADALFSDISNYKDVSTLQKELYYESRVFQCVKSIKKYLKNPDSMQIYEVEFYADDYVDGFMTTNPVFKVKKILDKLTEKSIGEPICILRYGAQNGFGGNTTGYSVFIYDTDAKTYQYIGNCDTLDEDKVDQDDEQICALINFVRENRKSEGVVNLDRIKTILKDSNYTSIKIID